MTLRWSLKIRNSQQRLNRKANRRAHYLIDQGVKSDDLVGLCIERSFDMIIGILGILKAGAAYVPLDPSYPHDRLQFILNDSQARTIVTQSTLIDSLPVTNQQIVTLDSSETKVLLRDYSPDNIGRQNLQLPPANQHM